MGEVWEGGRVAVAGPVVHIRNALRSCYTVIIFFFIQICYTSYIYLLLHLSVLVHCDPFFIFFHSKFLLHIYKKHFLSFFSPIFYLLLQIYPSSSVGVPGGSCVMYARERKYHPSQSRKKIDPSKY